MRRILTESLDRFALASLVVEGSLGEDHERFAAIHTLGKSGDRLHLLGGSVTRAVREVDWQEVSADVERRGQGEGLLDDVAQAEVTSADEVDGKRRIHQARMADEHENWTTSGERLIQPGGDNAHAERATGRSDQARSIGVHDPLHPMLAVYGADRRADAASEPQHQAEQERPDLVNEQQHHHVAETGVSHASRSGDHVRQRGEGQPDRNEHNRKHEAEGDEWNGDESAEVLRRHGWSVCSTTGPDAVHVRPAVSCGVLRIVAVSSPPDPSTKPPIWARYPVVECVVRSTEVELVVDHLAGLGTTGVEEIDGADAVVSTRGQGVAVGHVLLRAGFGSDAAAVAAEAALNALDGTWHSRFEVIVGDEWLDAWRDHFTTTRVGRIVVVPDWPDASADRPDTSTDDVVLRLDPGRSFGTGGHASTRLALKALQTLDVRGLDVADVGCGSGVLAVAAALLGAAHAHGTDVETAALEATMENARRNGVEDRCSVAKADVANSTRTYDVVLANILAPVLIELAGSITEMVRPGGFVVLAGLIDEQRDRVAAAYSGLRLEHERAEGAWCALTLRRAVTAESRYC
jgi:ribosomal protein L11 methyltransferase